MLTDRLALKHIQSVKHAKDCQKYPNVKPEHIPLCKFTLTKTNDIERAIVLWFALHGYKFERIKVQGRKVSPDIAHLNPITGKVQILEKGKWAKSTGAVGSADISGTCRNKQGGVISLRIEIKNFYTKDTVKSDQLKYKEEHERSGGTYIIIHTFGELMEWSMENVVGIDKYQSE